MLTLIGLGLIILAWVYQLVMIIKGNRGIQLAFVGLYALGVLLLVVNDMSEPTKITVLNLISFAVALLVCLFLVRRN